MATLYTFGDCKGMYLDNCNDSGNCSQGPTGPTGPAGSGGSGGGGTGPTGPAGPMGPTGPAGSGTGGSSTEFGLVAMNVLGQTTVYDKLYFNQDHGFSITGFTGPAGETSGAVHNVAYPMVLDVSGWLVTQPPPIEGASSTEGTVITLDWTAQTPAVQQSSFAVAPSGLGSQPTTNSRTAFDWLPFIKGFYLQYKTSTTSSGSWMHTVSDLDVTGSPSWSSFVNTSLQPNALNSIHVEATGSYSATNPSVTLSQSNKRLTVNLGANAIADYQFRFAYYNYADEGGATKSRVNWVYFPSETGYLAFGGFGPAMAPATITATSGAYNTLTFAGTGGLYMDASKNTPYGPSAPLDVQYGFDVSGSKISFIQVGGQTTDISKSVTTPWLKTQNWSVNDNATAYPEYYFETVADPSQTYYAANNSTDFSGVRAYAPGDVSDNTIVPIPTRSQANAAVNGTKYETPITGSWSTLSGVMGLTFAPAGTATDAWQRTPNTQPSYIFHNSVHFITQAQTMTITGAVTNKEPALNIGEPNASPSGPADMVQTKSKLGIDASGSGLSSFEAAIYSTVPSANTTASLGSGDISGAWPPTAPGALSNPTFSYDVSNVRDIAANTTGREHGYYLGCSVTNLIADISLSTVKDICNNNFNAYSIAFAQTMYANNGLPNEVFDLSAVFKVAENINQDISVNNYYTAGDSVQTSTGHFYGLTLPTIARFDVSYNIDDINQEWAPSNTGGIYKNELLLQTNAGGTKKTMDTSDEQWRDTHRDVSVGVLSTLAANYNTFGSSSSGLPYSRDSGNPGSFLFPQFIVKTDVSNNIRMIDPAFSVTTDVSYNGKYTWWDYTWTNGASAPTPTVPKGITVTNSVSGSSVQLSAKLTEVPSPTPFDETSTGYTDPSNLSNTVPAITSFNFGADIPFNMAMWAKDAYWGSSTGATANSTTNPYIDYTAFEIGAGTLRDYSVYDNSGSSATWKAGPTIYIGGGSVATTFSVTDGKWLSFVVDVTGTATTWSKCTITATRRSGTSDVSAIMGTDYFLFVKESSQAGGTNQAIQWFTSLPGQSPTFLTNSATSNTKFFNTPWLDAAIKFVSTPANRRAHAQAQDGSIADSLRGTANGCAANSGSSLSNPIIAKIHGNVAIKHYFAFCIPEGKNISGITLKYE